MDIERVNSVLSKAILGLQESEIETMTEALNPDVPVFQVVFAKSTKRMLGRKLKTLSPDRWYVFGVGPGVGPHGEPVRFGPYKSEDNAKKEANAMAKNVDGRVLKKIEMNFQKAIGRFAHLGSKMSGPSEYDV